MRRRRVDGYDEIEALDQRGRLRKVGELVSLIEQAQTAPARGVSLLQADIFDSWMSSSSSLSGSMFRRALADQYSGSSGLNPPDHTSPNFEAAPLPQTRPPALDQLRLAAQVALAGGDGFERRPEASGRLMSGH